MALNVELFQSGVGSLLYLATNSRPDLAYAVNALAQKMRAPTVGDWKRFKRVLRFLKFSKEWKLVYARSNSLKILGYSDADFANDSDRKSISGYCFLVNGAVISWKAKKQSLVATSSTESEYIALHECVKESLWLRKLELELSGRNRVEAPMVIHEDNQSAIKIAHNEGSAGRSKHIDLRFHFVRDRIKSKEIELKFCETGKMIADVLTKPLGKNLFERHANNLGLRF